MRGAVLYGVGKLLRDSRYDRGGFTPGPWRGRSAPECPFRALYAATHFMNFYEAAPAEEARRYVEDLALWGVNTVIAHVPTWDFQGFDWCSGRTTKAAAAAPNAGRGVPGAFPLWPGRSYRSAAPGSLP